jgi:hypothetical protein
MKKTRKKDRDFGVKNIEKSMQSIGLDRFYLFLIKLNATEAGSLRRIL